jgi:hypothetical protein
MLQVLRDLSRSKKKMCYLSSKVVYEQCASFCSMKPEQYEVAVYSNLDLMNRKSKLVIVQIDLLLLVITFIITMLLLYIVIAGSGLC